MNQSALKLISIDGEFAIARLEPDEPLPDWAVGDFFSVTRSDQEMSIVCPASSVPAEIAAERGWRGVAVAGPLEFDEVNVIATLTAPLANAEISVFVISTYDTDYVFVRDADFARTREILSGAGHVFSN